MLYGGAAGGGKSVALLMGAAQFVETPGYHSLLLRSSFPDLMKPGALIPLSKEWWAGREINGGRARWNQQEKQWTFPSGATITFGYLERDDDVYQYQGANFHFIGIDELTQHTEFRYRYLYSRLRRLAGSDVPMRMRAASNPGGIGHDWVKARFNPDGGGAEGRVFIGAKIADNPSLDRDEYLMTLAHLDPLTRAQLERGDWNAIASGRFKSEWLRHYHREPAQAWLRFGEHLYTIDEIKDRFLTVDCASTVKQTASDDPDWTVISAWGRTPNGWLAWLGCVSYRCETPDIPKHVYNEYVRYRATRVFIEDNGVGKGPAQWCQRHSGNMNVIPFTATREKLANASNAMNMMEAGRIWLPSDNPAFPLEEVEGQLLRFTGDKKKDAHDDIVDTLAKAANVVMSTEPARAQAGGAGVATKGTGMPAPPKPQAMPRPMTRGMRGMR